ALFERLLNGKRYLVGRILEPSAGKGDMIRYILENNRHARVVGVFNEGMRRGGGLVTEFKNRILQGDSLEVLQDLPDGLVNTCVTSPPYWGLRDYGVDGQLGAEPTPDEYVERMVTVFRE